MSYTLMIHGVENDDIPCFTCQNAVWQSFYGNEYDDIVEYPYNFKIKDVKFACFCTIIHSYIKTRRIYCDGNSPDSEPNIEEFLENNQE